MIEALRELAAARWREAAPERPALAGALVLGNGKAESSKVAVLFLDAAGDPAVVAKVARNDVAAVALAREHAALDAVRATNAPLVEVSAPHPLGAERVEGRDVLLMTALGGRPLYGIYHTPGHTSDRTAVTADLRAAAGWLLRLQRETRTEEVPADAAFWEAHAEPILARYRSEIGWSDEEDALFDAARRRFDGLTDATIPLAASHGDFWMGNLMVGADGGIAGVVDWELAGVGMPPFRDLYKFCTSYAFYMDRAYPGRGGAVPNHPGREDPQGRWRRFGSWPNILGFGHAYFGRGWFPDLVRATIEGHLAALGIPPAANGAFFPVFLAEQATVLDVAEFRDGYRSLILAFAAERDAGWLWTAV